MLTELGVASAKLDYPVGTVVLLTVTLNLSWIRQLMTMMLSTESIGKCYYMSFTSYMYPPLLYLGHPVA